jgi:tellurite resistance-related uncharacterized protein
MNKANAFCYKKTKRLMCTCSSVTSHKAGATDCKKDQGSLLCLQTIAVGRVEKTDFLVVYAVVQTTESVVNQLAGARIQIIVPERFFMKREITGFTKDEENHWVALLDCGHRQHTRHRPPFELREWTQTKEGRQSKLGEILECVRCDAMEWPEDFVSYKKTPVFTEDTVPKGLLANHSTRKGVWGLVQVEKGALRYILEHNGQESLLTPEKAGIVVPEMRHRVEPEGNVRFFVEFFRQDKNKTD